MTYSSIKFHCETVRFSRCLEIGPGPGTWTRVLFKMNSSAEFDLVDISEEMKAQFHSEMRAGLGNVRYHTGDFLGFRTTGQYDFVFSSRALEYFENKQQLAAHLAELLVSGAEGRIITKNPDLWLLRKFIGKQDSRPQHQRQVRIRELRALLEGAGFSDLEFYPAVIQLPLGRVASRFGLGIGLAERLYRRFCNRELSAAPTWLLGITESYIVRFRKR